jgi:hypothetical protein
LGYSLQTTRALMRLLEAQPGSFVSVEVLDDVAVTSGDLTTTVEQTKSAISQNPIADRSVELWKTLANWVRAVDSGDIIPSNTFFEIFVSRKQKGPIASSFASARTTLEAAAAIAEAKRKLWGQAPSYPERRRVATSLAPHVDCVLGAKPGVLSQIIERFSLVFGSRSSRADLITRLRMKIISVEALDVVANEILGWTKSAIDSRIEAGLPALVAVDPFNLELETFVRRVDRFAILNSFAPVPSRAKAELEVQGRTYVRQLDIIGADYDTKLQAANDYLRASVDRSVWASKGLVHRSSFLEFEDVLLRAWNAKKTVVAIQAKGQPPDAAGQLLFAECSQVRSPLEGRDVPPHFAPGCFHAMAEDLSVGWHPDYKQVLTQVAVPPKENE